MSHDYAWGFPSQVCDHVSTASYCRRRRNSFLAFHTPILAFKVVGTSRNSIFSSTRQLSTLERLDRTPSRHHGPSTNNASYLIRRRRRRRRLSATLVTFRTVAKIWRASNSQSPSRMERPPPSSSLASRPSVCIPSSYFPPRQRPASLRGGLPPSLPPARQTD